MKYFMTLLPILICLGCFKKADLSTSEVTDREEVAQEFNYLALGDSYTIGEGVEISERWPIQLVEKLNGNGYNISNVDIIAKTGWTTTNLIDAIDQKDIDSFNLVSLLIGVNNQFQNLSFDDFKMEFDILLNTAIEISRTPKKVFVVSIPDYGVTPFGAANSEKIGREIDMYNAYIMEQCKGRAVPFVDITQISRMQADAPEALASDRLHPSGHQYGKWVEKMLPIVESLID